MNSTHGKRRYIVFGLIATLAATALYAANRPKGFVTICKDGASCSVAAGTNVAYGRSDKFTFKVLTGSFVCGEATFGPGSRVAGGLNECSVSETAGGGGGGGGGGGTGACQAGSTVSGTVDCGGITIGTSCGGQAEGQRPVLTIADGGRIKNLRINKNAADGIHCRGNCTLENVVWEDVCEDAATMLGGAGKVMTIIGGSAANAEDKVFQHNGVGSTVRITGGFQTFGTIGKLYQSCGNCSNNAGPRTLDLNNVSINGPVSTYLLRLNRNFNDKATVRNLRVKGYQPGKPRVCVEAQGVQPGQAQSNFGEFFETTSCNIRRTDVVAF